ncbi:MAG: hypothetical protein M1343_03710 [Chloroflexi bacterium]|nr:hypothetical protein [Chloroflexota bacterium]MDA8188775.1 hypothetical protein [Dehalococcoidales bacterium]
MPTEKVDLVIFVGRQAASYDASQAAQGIGATSIERTLAEANQAIASDTIERALSTGICSRIIVATDSPEFASRLSSLPVTVEVDDEPFHFGRRLSHLIHKYQIKHPFYIGGGSTPLLGADEMAAICRSLLSQENVVMANNFYSADFAAFTPGTAIDQIELPDTDNNLAFPLHHQAGLRNVPIRSTASTQMDVDTPTDLAILRLHPGTGPHTREFLRGLDIDVANLEEILPLLSDPGAQIIVAGRVGSQTWVQLESSVACQTRVFSEERGMRASGRDVQGKVRSLLGYYLESQGVAKFFDSLGEMGDAALIDSRVIFEHLGRRPSAADRYNSDLLRAEEIVDPFVAEFTAGARSARIPVVLGGHSIVAGGLWALIESAWAAARRTPETSQTPIPKPVLR